MLLFYRINITWLNDIYRYLRLLASHDGIIGNLKRKSKLRAIGLLRFDMDGSAKLINDHFADEKAETYSMSVHLVDGL